jgi:hypothetical protein
VNGYLLIVWTSTPKDFRLMPNLENKTSAITMPKAVLIYALGVACFGVIGLFRTWSELDAFGASFVRGIWGALTLTIVALIVSPSIFKVSFSYFLRCIIWGGFLGVAILVYFLCMDYSNQSIAGLFLVAQFIWFPIYTKITLKEESKNTNWIIYISSNILTLFGDFFALGLVGDNSFINLNKHALFYGALVSFMAFVYFVVGRWLFFFNNNREKEILYKIASSVGLVGVLESLELSDKIVSKDKPELFLSFQKTLFQSYGMAIAGFLYVPYNERFVYSLFNKTAILNGFFLGSITLALAFSLITYADSVSVIKKNGDSGRLNTKIKGISQQLELVIAISLGYYLLEENIGPNGVIGCIVLIASYIVGTLFSEKKQESCMRINKG